MAQKIDLSKTAVFILQNNQTELDMLAQVFVGFGVASIRKYLSIEEAETATRKVDFDLIVVDAEIPDGGGFEFIRRLRRATDNPNRLAPVLLVAGHTPKSAIMRARDCGANIVVTKPITPKTMFDRIVWLVKDQRSFVESEHYVGPDRRHKAYGPPPGTRGRRKDDLNPEIGAPQGPDLMQAEIDALLQPKKAV